MKLRTRVAIQLTALCLLLGAYSFAADSSYLYIVNATPGRDMGSSVNPAYPIDVLINGVTCLPRNTAYATTSVPFTLTPGTYDVLISESNSLMPCTNPAIVDSQVTLAAGQTVSAVLGISGSQVSLLPFTDNLGTVTTGNARFVFTNAADAPELQATLTQVGVKNPLTFTVTAGPGAQQAITVPFGTYTEQVTAVGSTTVLVSQTMTLPNQSVTFTYAAGKASKFLGLVNKVVPGVD